MMDNERPMYFEAVKRHFRPLFGRWYMTLCWVYETDVYNVIVLRVINFQFRRPLVAHTFGYLTMEEVVEWMTI